MAPCLRAASPPGVGPSARSRGARARDLPPRGSGGSIQRTSDGCQGERRTPGGRAGRTPLPSGADGLLSRALNGLPDHAARPGAERVRAPRTSTCTTGARRDRPASSDDVASVTGGKDVPHFRGLVIEHPEPVMPVRVNRAYRVHRDSLPSPPSLRDPADPFWSQP
jgi:hypothetical protein